MNPKPASVLRSPGSLQVELLADGGTHLEHWYSIREGSTDRLRLLSVGAAASQPLDTAPPWQECSVEDHGAGDVLLAVGRSGRDHWSAAWTCFERDAIRCEIACRCHDGQAPCEVWLSVSDGFRVASLDAERAVIAGPDAGSGGELFELTTRDMATLSVSDTHNHLVILRAAPGTMDPEAAPVTRQLGFSLRRCEC